MKEMVKNGSFLGTITSCIKVTWGTHTMKGQNIGSSTKKVYKKIFDSDVRNENICLSALLKAMPFALLLKMAE